MQNSMQMKEAARSLTALTGEQDACAPVSTIPDANLATLHAQYLGAVFCYVTRHVPRPQEAEDITAEVFAAAVQQWPRYRGACRPYAWLLGIARRKVADSLRRQTRHRETLATEMAGSGQDTTFPLDALLSPAEGPEVTAQREEARQAVRAAMARLKEVQREALLLQYVEELPVAEIAVVMRKSPAAVNSLLQRARRAFQRQMQGYFGDAKEGKR